MNDLIEIKENPKWVNGPQGNEVLQFDGFYISYNPQPGGGISCFQADDNSDETALYNEKNGKFYILNGDFRLTYEKLALEGGFDECLKYHNLRKKELGSSWSNG